MARKRTIVAGDLAPRRVTVSPPGSDPVVELDVVAAGEGPVVVLLHGFPEIWWSWRAQIPYLVERGFRVLAPDQRGYGHSTKPGRVADYRVEALADDVAGLLDREGVARAHVVGHDWGGMVAWQFAMRHPGRLDRLAILNVPHPARFLQGLRTLRQLRKSWYVFLFQLPGVAERMLAAGDFAALRRLYLRGSRRPGAFTPEDVERYVEAFRVPGALPGALSWYRAAGRRLLSGDSPEIRSIAAETLVVWGERDAHLGAELAEPSPRLVPRCRVVRIPEASHWVQNDAPEIVNRELAAHFGRPEAPAS